MSVVLGSQSGVYILGTPVDDSVILRQATIDDIEDETRFEMQPFAVLVPNRNIQNKEELHALGGDPSDRENLIMRTCFAHVETHDDEYALVAIDKSFAFFAHISRVFIMKAEPKNMLMPSYTNVDAIFDHALT